MTTPEERPTPTDGPGWYPDPQGSGKERYFDGENWTDRIRTSARRVESGHRPGFMDRVREAPMLVKVGVPVVLVAIIAAVASGGSGSSRKGDDQTTTTGQTSGAVTNPASTEDKATTSKARETKKVVTEGESGSEADRPDREGKPSRSGPSAEQQVKEALGDKVNSGFAVGDSEVRSVEVAGPVVNIPLQTPSGGFEGPTTRTHWQAPRSPRSSGMLVGGASLASAFAAASLTRQPGRNCQTPRPPVIASGLLPPDRSTGPMKKPSTTSTGPSTANSATRR